METEPKTTLRYARICALLVAAILVVVCVAAALLVPRALRALDHAEEALTEVETLAGTAGTALAAANEALASAEAAADAANRLVADNADAVSEAMAKFNSVDFETLNRAINDLADIVEPLARVSNFFNR